MWREAVTQPVGVNQYTMEGADNVSTHSDGHGNSKSYTLDCLKREAPQRYRRVLGSPDSFVVDAKFFGDGPVRLLRVRGNRCSGSRARFR